MLTKSGKKQKKVLVFKIKYFRPELLNALQLQKWQPEAVNALFSLNEPSIHKIDN